VDVHSTYSTSLPTIPAIRTVSSPTVGNKQVSEISEKDLQQLRQLKTRDQVVRAHEAAHLAAASGLVVGGANYSFQRGSDGVQYAIGGEVSIDTSKVAGDPHATLQKAEQIQTAALAPTQPSSQDRAVAARAAQMAIEAKAEISQQVDPNKIAVSINASSRDDTNSPLGNTIDITA
tara:strand:+ start:220399 stop:220926 length:528 start_codon:yes stop_codon:yes gene_type:complete